ncbi:MAG: class I SAM-dependent methyltransferase [Pseudomonadota bacterium]
MDHATLGRIYDGYARIYDRLFGRVFDEPRRRAVEQLAAKPGERVLEVGVGTGIALPMYPQHADVVGVDYSAGMLREAQACLGRSPRPRTWLLRMDAMRMAFPDNSFDALMAAYVVTAVPDCHRVVAEMARVCRPGGRLLLVNHLQNRNRLVAFGQRLLCPLTRRLGWRTDLSIEDVLRGSSFVPVSVQTMPPLGLWYLIECRNDKPA